MKNVILLVPALGIGGQERIAINTGLSLKDCYNVKFVVYEKKEVEYAPPCTVINIDLPAKNGGLIAKIFNQIKRILKVAKIRKKEKADIIISFGNSANLTNVFSGIISRGKTISAVHGFAEVKKGFAMKSIIRFSDKVICIAKAMQEALLNLFPKANNTVVIENGYDIDEIVRKSVVECEFENLAPAVVSMGRMETVKGFDRLVKAFAIVKKTQTDLKLILLGKGILREELGDLAALEGVSDSVHFLGCHDNPFKFLKNSILYVMSSRNEGFPNALIEALACELPIVSIDCQSGPREILSEHYSSDRVRGIIKEKFGMLVEESVSEEKNIQGIADAILMLINDQAKMSEYRSRGIERAYQFSNDVYREKIISLIEGD